MGLPLAVSCSWFTKMNEQTSEKTVSFRAVLSFTLHTIPTLIRLVRPDAPDLIMSAACSSDSARTKKQLSAPCESQPQRITSNSNMVRSEAF